MKRRFFLLILTLLFSYIGFSQSGNFIFSFGYMAKNSTQIADTADTFRVSVSTGMPVFSQWADVLDGRAMSGFPYVPHYVLTFAGDLFASKGYYSDYVELKWRIANYDQYITSFKIFRKPLGSAQDSQLVASLPPETRFWQDKSCESGVLYQYTVIAEGISPIIKRYLTYTQGVGFRQTYGIVTGRITYKGGTAVRGVNVYAQSQDTFPAYSLKLNGSDNFLQIHNDPNNFAFDTAFTFQAWYLPENSADTMVLFQKGNQYQALYHNGTILFTTQNQSVTLKFTPKVDTFFNLILMRSPDSLTVAVFYGPDNYYTASQAITTTTPANSSDIFIGQDSAGNHKFTGYIDEMRIWKQSFKLHDLFNQTTQFISGAENNLCGYYRMNEGIGQYFYDLSHHGTVFNANDGSLRATWVHKVPLRSQLAVKGVTDDKGNYIISGIPFSINGTVYNIVPVYQVHRFDPEQKVLYFSNGNSYFSSVDFIDIASFPVTGNVVYRGTHFPVEGVMIKVDGRLALNADGQPIKTDINGNFTVDVPIGRHYLQLYMNGHKFSNGRFPADSGSLYEFTEPYTFQQPFIDTTLIKVIGRVVGGPVQAAKPAGLGESTENLGNPVITLSTQKEFDLSDKSTDTSGTWPQNVYQGDSLVNVGKTGYSIEKISPKNITIYPDPNTGEFVAWLLPEKYIVKDVRAGNYVFDDDYHIVMDLSNRFFRIKSIDSVLTDQYIAPNGDTVYEYRTDSTSYNAKFDFIYRTKPEIIVTDPQGHPAFWEKQVQADNGQTVTVVNDDGSPKTLYPIFLQRKDYKLKIRTLEVYTNVDQNNKTDSVPVTDGVIEIQNALALHDAKQKFQLDKTGTVYYTFKGGAPNITTGGIGDYLKTMQITAYTGKNGSIVTNWLYKGDIFKAYLLGGIATGSNFVTAGPIQLITILRDPPGSGSYSYFEKDQTLSSTNSYELTVGTGLEASMHWMMGTDITSFVGMGAGVINEVEAQVDMTLSASLEMDFTNNHENTLTVTNTERWETGSDPDFVGPSADLFIGYSTNIVYGEATFVSLLPDSSCNQCVTDTLNGYSIGIRKGFRFSPEFGTGFMYSQDHIENYLIPALKMLRDNFLQNNSNYTSVLPPSDPNYGRPNKTGQLTATGWQGGDSYNYTIPDDWDKDKPFVDSVQYYNDAIQNWQQLLAINERDKIQAKTITNQSFSSGVTYENSETHEASESYSNTVSIALSTTLATEIGASVNGFGASMGLTLTSHFDGSVSVGGEQTNSVTYGYVLNDPDQGDYLSVDIKSPPDATGTVFSTKGGQTSCPYEGEDVSKYYQPGTVLSQATMKREGPQIQVKQATVDNVPEDEPAVFNISLANVSQAINNDVWLLLSVDEQTNQNGALIKLDGSPINSGRMIYFPENNVAMNKILTIEKTQPDIYDYDSIGIILSSVCDPGSIADTIYVSAHFLPVCANVELYQPDDQWVVNTITGPHLNISFGGYDLSHRNFEKILFQYKASSSSQWLTAMSFYVNKDDYDAAAEPKEYIDGRSVINYQWDMSSLPDRKYDLRVVTICSDGTINSSEISHGIKDMHPPQVFGTPQPADGILSPGEDVMITFNEPIQQNLLTPYNFSVRGVLNGAPLRHQAAVYFDGDSSYASVQSPVSLSSTPFTVEFWTKRTSLRPGVIFTQGPDIEMGFDPNNRFYVKLGSKTYTTSKVFNQTDDWIHFGIVYDLPANQLNVYANDQIVLDQVPVTAPFSGDGRLFIGKSQNNDLFYNGYIHDFRIWTITRTFGSIYADMLKRLTGNEIGLAGFWPMDEAWGNIAQDMARSHHAILFKTNWAVFPQGYCLSFNGTNAHADLPGSNIAITDQMDYTVEFWFKGNYQTNAVMFSNGKGDSTDVAPGFENILNIGFDKNGNLFVKNNGSTLTIPDKNFLDGKWHHLAFVLNRLTNAKLYIDGQLQGYLPANLFGGLQGDITIGARRHNYQIGSTDYDNFFNGKIDELRIWNLARTAKLLQLYMNTKLNCDEVGLLAYYPFEDYDASLQIEPTLKDLAKISNYVGTGVSTQFEHYDVANIKGSKPIQNLAFDWVSNSNKIIINLKEDPAVVEKTIVEFTVSNVEDLQENRMTSPVTWTAYIQQNTVVWDQSQFFFKKKIGDTLSFTAKVLNKGGTEEKYEIMNIPPWLDVSPNSGTLSPNSSQTITFKVDPYLNIGTYNIALYLSSDFGYNEKLPITLKVYAQAPDWQVDPSQYQYSMGIVGQVKIDGQFAINTDDIVAAFINGQCRGVAKIQYVEQYDMYYFFMNIYSNKDTGDTITFKIWDASAGLEHDNVSPQIIFHNNTVVGSPLNPLILETYQSYTRFITMTGGWKWFSINLESSKMSDLNSFLQGIDATPGDVIKGQTAFSTYSGQLGWQGSLTAKGLSNTQMYMIHTEKPNKLKISGARVKASATAIPISTGWNWIAYTPQVYMTVANAFTNYNPAQGDIIKSQYKFSMYDKNLGWIGSLQYLKPGDGYMFKTYNSPGQLIFPDQTLYKITPQVKDYLTVDQWNFNPNSYQYNMSVVAQALINGQPADSSLIIGAFDPAGNCVGIAKAQPVKGKNLYFLTVYGNSQHAVTFRAIENNKNYIGTDTINFSPNALTGTLDQPLTLNFEQTHDIINSDIKVNVYPNPFVKTLTITYSLQHSQNVDISIYNLYGQKIRTITKGLQQSGIHTIKWTPSTEQANGVYLIRVTTPQNTGVIRVTRQ